MIKQKVLYQAKVTTEYLPPATCPFLLSYHLPMRSLLPPFSQYCSILMQYLAEDPIFTGDGQHTKCIRQWLEKQLGILFLFPQLPYPILITDDNAEKSLFAFCLEASSSTEDLMLLRGVLACKEYCRFSSEYVCVEHSGGTLLGIH